VSLEDEAALAKIMQELDFIINAVAKSNDGATYALLVISGADDLTLDLP
jgi:hypothetical protein